MKTDAQVESATGSEELAGYPVLLQTLLRNRDIGTFEEAEKFLNPSYENHSSDPFLMLDMEKAVGRILQAIKKEEKIVIYGDYDCDGIPGSVVLHDFFKRIGYKHFKNYIPHRHDEGYGLNIPALEKFAEEDVKVVITVDCGIVNVLETARGEELGINMIITDHHLPGRSLPPAFAVINPKREGDPYPDKMLCGAGVAFKLVQALLKRGNFETVPDGWEKWLLDMAGLSTIADMVPLRNENRMIAYYGLKVLRKSPRAGVRKLLKKIKVDQTRLSEDDIGFMIAPRINAASRMDIPLRAFELLSTDDEVEAERLAEHLNHLNDQRKGSVASMVKEARKGLSSREIGTVAVLGNPNWAPGLLGLAASSIMEDLKRPVFVWGRDGEGKIKGSCRSDGSVSVVELMGAAPSGTFSQFGGHAAAGGFAVPTDIVHTLEQILSEVYESFPKIEKAEKVFFDAKLSLDEVNRDTALLIDKLAPFGMENPKPVFLFENIEVENVRSFGKVGNHLSLDLKNSRGRKIPAISFFGAEKFLKDQGLTSGTRINLFASIERSFFRNFEEIRLRIVSLDIL